MGRFGVNLKAQQGRERKVAQKEIKKQQEEERREEQLAKEWSFGAKTKSARQIQEDQKRQEKSQRQAEKKRLLASEEAELAKFKPLRPLPRERTGSSSIAIARAGTNPSPQGDARLRPGGDATKNGSFGGQLPEYSASNVDDAVFLLQRESSPKIGAMERHPERRAKAAFAVFEEREMPRLKAEFPQLRYTQLRERLQRAWHKSPENPFNQAHIPYNATKDQATVMANAEVESNLERLRVSEK